MPFQTPITVKEAVESIHQKKYLLPAIQREVVWEPEQITRLFDSLMRDYPIGSFLFWHVDRQRVGNYQFYEFVRKYHERDNPHNQKANVDGQSDIVGILDGQQRLTALYIGLKGSYAYKEPRKRWDNPQAFPVRKLYLDLLNPKKQDEQSDGLYKFAFLTDEEARQADTNVFWFKVGEILNLHEQFEVNNYLIDNALMNRADQEQAKFANRTLFKLWNTVHDSTIINYFLERDESLDKVLNIFIRVNSGGTVLSYSDLLLSVATAQWQNKDAREVITTFVDEINNTGDGFNFDKDFVLKSSVVLTDTKDIAFKVDNFNRANMSKIENEWEEIERALRAAVTLVSGFGYSRDTLTSNFAVIPIAYYLKKIGCPSNYDTAERYVEDRKAIRRWLTFSLVKRVFGGTPDSVLRPVREVIKENGQAFPLNPIIEKFKGAPKSIVFTEDDIENLLQHKYTQKYTFSVLSLLYPSLDYRNKFHVDHIHPRSSFTPARLLRQGVQDKDVSSCLSNYDMVPNLQFLEGVPNQEKSNTPFEEWLAQTCGSADTKASFMSRNYIPNMDLSLAKFPRFFEARRLLMHEKLKSVLIDGN
ncbi:MAG: DUF262 domain-containing protein [Candidatus Abyssobacteria bacterium SURF_5]|uniref:DUF262 domain-containing protein n=1 Tax=Abyssobacteria bacterium (strain SURF_5) TaxID=2093360 RepID=A0A3A4NIL5_ABYX5|nr:MAG: DUF262 domain-containing protein [Candidatus Abyssubacteria bacterium SURF_5]